MNAMFFAKLLIVVLVVAVVICLTIVQQLQRQLAYEKAEKEKPYLIFSFEGPEELFSVKNVGMTPVSLITIHDLDLALHLEFKKTVTLKFEPVPMLGPREAAPLKFKIFDQGYPLHTDTLHSMLPHLKASSFEVTIAYRDWQDVPHHVTIIKDQNRFFAKNIQTVPS